MSGHGDDTPENAAKRKNAVRRKNAAKRKSNAEIQLKA
jgi:hypothetical protein